MFNKLIQEVNNSPISFIGGVIAIGGLIYTIYVFILNGNLPSLPIGNYVIKLLILILLEAPLAYFFVQVHIKIAEKGHGLPLFGNLFSIIISALVSCFNVSVLSFQDMLGGSTTYFIVMIFFSLFCALYLLSSEIHSRKKKVHYQIALPSSRKLEKLGVSNILIGELSSLRRKRFQSEDDLMAALRSVAEGAKDDEAATQIFNLVEGERREGPSEAWMNWLGILAAAYLAAFLFCGTSVFPEVYGKACQERLNNGEDPAVLARHPDNCDEYIELPGSP